MLKQFIVKVSLTSFLVMALSCTTNAGGKSDKPVLDDRKALYHALITQKLLNKHRQLMKMAHLCDLIIEGKHFPVIEVREHVKGAQMPRAVLHVYILDSSLNYVNKIYHDAASSPLYCKSNKLYWYGSLNYDDKITEDNIITFSEGGKKFVTSGMEINDFPIQKPPQ